ncbi:unnamed protein product [Symbiodinium natans]|uniref:C3H1-type domain-containing protein n=1 Tax=Symbiodinium natans TaxID=878477 RepID=A0A812PAY9_9DINO|nr:unnamed protein product [Symbiodinium natans]
MEESCARLDSSPAQLQLQIHELHSQIEHLRSYTAFLEQRLHRIEQVLPNLCTPRDDALSQFHVPGNLCPFLFRQSFAESNQQRQSTSSFLLKAAPKRKPAKAADPHHPKFQQIAGFSQMALSLFWGVLVFMGDCSGLFKQIQCSEFASHHTSRILSGYATNTVLRYLAAWSHFVANLEGLGLCFGNLDSVMMADILVTMSLEKHGILSRGTHSWVSKYLHALDRLATMHVRNHPDSWLPSFLLPAVQGDSFMFPLQAMSYAEALRWLRHFLLMPWASAPPEVPPLNFTVHSLKATMLSMSLQVNVDEVDRKRQGHHRISSSALYSRDDVHGMLRCQSCIRDSIRTGFRFLVPQHRGGQQPLTPAYIPPEAFSKDYEFEPFQWFSFPLDGSDDLLQSSNGSWEVAENQIVTPDPDIEVLDKDLVYHSDPGSSDESDEEPSGPPAEEHDLGEPEEFLLGSCTAVLHVLCPSDALSGTLVNGTYMRAKCGATLPADRLMIHTSEGLAAEVIKVATEGGWTASAFKHVVETQAEVEGAIPEIFPGQILSRLQIAQIKAAWAGMQTSSSSSALPAPVNADPTLETWVESFAPKIASTKLSEMKRQFLANYPSEVLNPSTLPSLRLISLAAHQEARSEYKWIAWKHRMTEEKASELLIARPHKQPKLEMLGLSSLLLDDPPTIEVTDANMGISGIQRILAVHDVALAMVGSAHLARLKAYSCKFVQLVSQRFDPTSGLRAPTILEAQQADCRIWQSIHSLVSEKAWSLNDALHEFTEIRGELSTLLQARPKALFIPRGPDLKGKGKQVGQWKGLGKGQGRGKEKGGKPKGAPGRHITFVKEIQVGSEKKGLCVQWQIGRCTRGGSCPFVHACAYPKQAGANRVAGYDIQPAARPAEPVNVLPKSVSLLETNAGPVSSPAVQCPQGNIPSQPVLGDVTCNMPGRSRNEVTPGQERYFSGSGGIGILELWGAPRESFGPFISYGETWNALCVSRNILTSPHKDTANLPGSSNLTVGIGSYSDGGLWVEDQAGTVPQFIPKLGVTLPGKIVTTHHAPFKFPVHLWHCTQPWLGDRWVLTAFTLPGVVGYCAASPCCSEYSRLKLFGGAMSWEESCVQGWLHCGSTALIVLPACAFGENWAKTWLFASSFQALSVMGQTCQHGRNAHESVQGRESDGSFKSRKTAKYPQCLAEEFALHIRSPLLWGLEHPIVPG